jgi:hypothetical protein
LPVIIDIKVQLLNTTPQLPVEILCDYSSPITLSSGGLPSGGWYGGNGVNDAIFSPADAGLGAQVIQYHYTSAIGCNISASDTIIVDACVGLGTADPTKGWNLFPHPTSGLLSISVYSATGQLIRSETHCNFESGSIDLSELESGAYFVRISMVESSSN